MFSYRLYLCVCKGGNSVSKHCNIDKRDLFLHCLSKPFHCWTYLWQYMTTVAWLCFLVKIFTHNLSELSWEVKLRLFLPGFYVPHTWLHTLKCFIYWFFFLVATVDTHTHIYPHDLCVPSASFSTFEICYLTAIRDNDNIVDKSHKCMWKCLLIVL